MRRSAIFFGLALLSWGRALAGGIGLAEVARRCGGSLSYGQEGRVGTVQAENCCLTFRHNSACHRLNGVSVYGQHPTRGDPGALVLDSADWNRVLAPLLTPAGAWPLGRVCIDAGHGGRDSGTVQGTLQEKNLTLDIALRLQRLLEEKHIATVLTRGGDTFVPLERRPEIAGGCDLLVSIHCNAAETASAEGIETYVLPAAGTSPTARLDRPGAQDQRTFPNNRCDEQNLWLGYCLQRQLVAIGGTRDRGVRRGRFLVLRACHCPAALVECGFLTHGEEGRRLGTEEHREAIARAICRGICHYGGRR
ncbi:MAG: N-acetylmuramoyl-L-alanine amidase [Puniceicoccales bacterium]|jgi:N-acetylmuramoyl-L-alanine amidase|nr:N-acetylmuramoyl-L-alanine amidase [Puniceicoccales bacterium]